MYLNADQFRDYVETQLDAIITKAFLSFASSGLLTHLPNNKGKAILPNGSISDDIVFKWKELNLSDFSQKTDIGVIEIESHRAQFRDKYVPEALENVYLGRLRQAGQNPKDFPFEAFVLEMWVKAMRQFNEKNLWNAKADANSDSGNALYDGLLEQVATNTTNGNLTPFSFGLPYVPRSKDEIIPAGYTSIIDIVETMYKEGIPEALKGEEIQVYMSTGMLRDYQIAYRNVYGTKELASDDLGRFMLDGTNEYAPAYLRGVPGMLNSQRIIMTPLSNAYYTYDTQADSNTFRFQDWLNLLLIFGSYRIGAKFLLPIDEWMAVNDLA